MAGAAFGPPHLRDCSDFLRTNKVPPLIDGDYLGMLTTCSHGCMSDIASVMHAKFYLFSQAGSARYVSMISSANPLLSSWSGL